MLNKEALRFVNRKTSKEIIGDKDLTDENIYWLNKLFSKYRCKELENMHSTIAKFVKYDLKFYESRIRRLKGIPGTTSYTQFLRYGRNFNDIMSKQSKSKTSHFKNTEQYWLDRGLSTVDAKIKISEIQRRRGLIAGEKLRGTSEYSCRSMSYWIKRGYSEEEAKLKVKQIQTTNGLEYYVEKYGKSKGILMFEKRINKWLKTLNAKSDSEKEAINLKKAHSIEGNLARGKNLEEAMLLYNNFCEQMRMKTTSSFSKISQDLFNKLEEKLYGTSYYYTKNYEYLINSYRVDFYHKDSKTVIEFYGDFFHRNPKIYESSFEAMNYRSDDRWTYDKNREKIIIENTNVDNLLIIWESDYRSNPESVIQKCLKIIGEKYVC